MKNGIKLLSFIAVLLIISCQHDDAPQVYEKGTNEYANQWIYDQMQRYYYWANNLPSGGNLSIPPKEYFKSLLYREDRFSYALNLNDAATFPKSLRNLYGFDMEFVEHEGRVFGVVLYVLSNAPAQYAGLQRGQLITAVDNVPLNAENYNEVYNGLSLSQNVNLQIMDYSQANGFSVQRSVNISRGIVLLEPVRSKILQQGSRTVGYIDIPHFDVGLSQSLLNAFAAFKTAAVNEIIVDLRYNGGGDVSSATALCILLAPNIQADDKFIRFKGNANGGEVNQSFKEALKTNEQQVTFESLRNAHSPVNRVYILCGSHTASASEIIINNLRPFMEVITIGEKTVGKDTATFPVEDERATQGQDKWVLYPAIYKLFNANGEGNYTQGITPAIILNELAQLEIHALGNQNEILLNHALNAIAGNGRLATAANTTILKKLTTTDDSEPVIINKF